MPTRIRKRSTETLLRQVGKRIAEVRHDRGMTQEVLAEKVGITVQSLGRAETGKAALGLERLDQLAHALGCELSQLLEGAGQPIPKSPWAPDEAEAAETWRAIPSRRRELALKVLRQFK